MRIYVTTEDIQRGRPVECKTCPVALAIQRAIKPEIEVRVATHECHFAPVGTRWLFPILGHFPGWKTIPFPDEVRIFIRRFDEWQDTLPFSFSLPIPVEFLREAA